jgi:Mrp family chromosome partitioning ATPase
MSRVYSVLTGATRPTGPAAIETPDANVWEDGDNAPFVEIGGPSGPIFSATPSASPTSVASPASVATPRISSNETKPEVKIEVPRAYPRLVPPPTPAYLSVRFHDVIARAARPLGDVPDHSLVALHFPEHAVSSEYRVLRDAITQQIPVATSRVLQFASAMSEAGTTTVLLNLAITLAHDTSSRVLVVDANVNHPAVAAKLALKSAPGLCEVLAGHVPLAWALQASTLPNLQALAAGDSSDATKIALSRDFPKLLGQLRQWFDWVLVDAGVWGTIPERDASCPAADAMYLVTRESDAQRPEFTSLRGSVKELGGLLRGYVATRV